MAIATRSQTEADDRSWYVVGRWGEYEGEGRANFLRIVGVASFYLIELANRWGLRLGVFEIPRIASVDRPFHVAVTAIAVGWIMMALAVHMCLRSRLFPASLKFLTTSGDIVFMTCVLTVSNGPRSPLVVGYFLIVALAALRMSLPLLRFATVGCIVGYLVVLAHAKWFSNRNLTVPRYHELMFILALALTGITIGQVLRRVRGMAVEFAERRASEREGGNHA